MVAALVHINEIATNSCGPSRVNHSHFWAEGSQHCSGPSKPATLVLFGKTRVVHPTTPRLNTFARTSYIFTPWYTCSGDVVHTFAFKDAQNYWEIWVQGSGIVFGLLELGG